VWDESSRASFPIVVEAGAAQGGEGCGTKVDFVDYCDFQGGAFEKILQPGGLPPGASRLFLTYDASASKAALPLSMSGLIPDRTFRIQPGSVFLKTILARSAVGWADKLTLRAFLVLNGKLAASSDPVSVSLVGHPSTSIEGMIQGNDTGRE
jgi:hypothetical protein